jgi:chemotaxis protein MotB
VKKKKVHHEEHVDESWLIPYADMLTLLLALFIVMFAMGQTDKAKLQKISQEFNIIFSGGSGLMEGNGSVPIPGSSSSSSYDTKGVIEEDKMSEVKLKLEEEIKSKGYRDKVKVVLNKDGLEISIQDAALFNSGDADILKDFSPLLLQISTMLQKLDNDIKVVGHTDNLPIVTEKFRSNWDLSSMRAINVMRFMVDAGKLHAEQFSIQAYGQYKPKFDNSTPDGRAKNRRVEIFIERKYPEVKK